MSDITRAQNDKLLKLNRDYGLGKITSTEFYRQKNEMMVQDKEQQKQKYDLKLAQTRAKEMKKAIKIHKKEKGKEMPTSTRKRSM